MDQGGDNGNDDGLDLSTAGHRNRFDQSGRSLANGRLDRETIVAFNELQFGMHKLGTHTPTQQFIYVSLAGFLITVAMLAVQELTYVQTLPISLYCVFIGMVFYFTLARVLLSMVRCNYRLNHSKGYIGRSRKSKSER